MSYGLRGRGGRLHGLGIFNPQGLGFDYYDLLASAGGTRQCDPRDSACVAQNEQITDAVRALWTSQYMTNPDVANQPVPDVTVNLNTSPAALQQYMQNVPVTSETISVQGGPVQTAAQWLVTPPLAAPAPVVRAAASAPAAGPSAAPAPLPGAAAGATAGAPALSSSLSAPTLPEGFSPVLNTLFMGIPVWGWGVGLMGAFFLFGGQRGR